MFLLQTGCRLADQSDGMTLGKMFLFDRVYHQIEQLTESAIYQPGRSSDFPLKGSELLLTISTTPSQQGYVGHKYSFFLTSNYLSF